MRYNPPFLIPIGFVITMSVLLYSAMPTTAQSDSIEYIVKLDGPLRGTMSGQSSPALTFSRGGRGVQSVQSTYITVKVPIENQSEQIQAIRSIPGVKSVEPNYPVQISTVSDRLNDPLIAEQIYLNQSTILSALEIVPGRVVKVAVVDTGVDVKHPDLSQQIAVNSAEVANGLDDDNNGLIDDIKGYSFYGYSFGRGSADASDVHGHGTHIAGIIAAAANNQQYGSGINPAARIIPVAFMDSGGRGTQFDAAAAIKYAADLGAEVINCSWGYFIYSGVLADAVAYAVAKGALVVAAAGNDGGIFSEFPASFDSVISVGSCGLNGSRSSFSNQNSAVDVLAYGESILSILPGKRNGRLTGTSQSAGVVSGVVSRLLSASPTKSIQIKQITDFSQTQSGGPRLFDATYLVQALALPTADILVSMSASANGILEVKSDIGSVSVQLTNVLNFPNPARYGTTHFGFMASHSGTCTIRVFDLSGRRVMQQEYAVVEGKNAIAWDLVGDYGKSLANGTYLYLIEFTGNAGKARAKGKLTVLR